MKFKKIKIDWINTEDFNEEFDLLHLVNNYDVGIEKYNFFSLIKIITLPTFFSYI
jgi:hypothetical protein